MMDAEEPLTDAEKHRLLMDADKKRLFKLWSTVARAIESDRSPEWKALDALYQEAKLGLEPRRKNKTGPKAFSQRTILMAAVEVMRELIASGAQGAWPKDLKLPGGFKKRVTKKLYDQGHGWRLDAVRHALGDRQILFALMIETRQSP